MSYNIKRNNKRKLNKSNMMRHLHRWLCAAGLCGSLCLHAQQPLQISGTVEGVSSGRLLLIIPVTETQVDTIATTTFKESQRFVLEGTVSEPTGARIMLENYSGGFFFFAEPGKKYEARLANDESAYVRSSDGLQAAWLQYGNALRDIQARRDSLQEEFNKLRAQSKFRSASAVNDKLEAYKKESGDHIRQFLSAHDDALNAYIAYDYICKNDLGARESRLQYERLGTNARKSIYGRMLIQRAERLEAATSGNPAPDFTLNTPEGTPVTLSRVKAKIKIVDFWASWCGPCRLNNPKLKEIYAAYKDKGLEIIGVSLDTDKRRWQDAIAKDGLPWIQVSSLKGWKCSTASLYGVSTVPSMFVIDETGHIIATGLKGEALEQFVARQLGD